VKVLMSQESYNLWSVIIGIAGALISVAVGIVIYWYTRVTDGLRQQSEHQTELIREQLQVSRRQAELFAEQVLSAIRPFVTCEITSFVRGGNEFPPGHPMRFVNAVYYGNLWNPSDRVAHDLRVLVHEHSTGYYWSNEPPVLRKAGESATWSASGPLDEDRALRHPENVYGAERIHFQRQVLEQNRDRDYIAIFFRDVNGNVYASFSFIVSPLQQDYGLRLTQILLPPG
jgi:hypothetical protein